MDGYYKHYIRTDADGRVIKGFSDAFEQPLPDDICIDEQGGYQFRLAPDGAENPALFDEHGVPLYKWDGSAVAPRTQPEIGADRPPEPEPTQTPEQRIAQLEGELITSYLAQAELYERTLALEQDTVTAFMAITEIYETMGGM